MHELPIVRQVLQTSLAYAESRNATQIKTVFLEIGELHDLVPEWVEKYFAFASKGTVAENAKILISRPPVIAVCKSCGTEALVDIHHTDVLICNKCKGEEFNIKSGDQFMIRGIEVI